jgi:hypothetical protein
MSTTMPSLIDIADLLGYVASGLVLVTFSARSIAALRAVAILSNLMFIAYALAAQLPPVLVLHVLLLPLNVWRLWEARESRRNGSPLRGRRFDWSA